ncbi:MAG TPA: cupin domain-containing protein [Bacteroidales bacterium]|nr:cupin domain-containing protein [Bacteroidales bacterium]
MSPFATSKILQFSSDVEYSLGGIVSKRVLEKTTGNVSLFAFDKGQKLSEHSAPFDALVQVIEGEVDITINKEPFCLKAGQAIIMPANVPHAVHATEQFKMLLTMIKS